MFIDQLIQYCHRQYETKTGQCANCPNRNSGGCSSPNCSTCFSDMFFGATGRTFNCEYSTFSYVCRYTLQYSSEIIHLLRTIKTFFDNKTDEINIMSIGCGPCSEAFAFDCFFDEIGYNKENVVFTGFDTNMFWANVQNKANEILPFPINIVSQDCFEYIALNEDVSYPDILIMNYLLSDIAQRGDLDQFVADVVEKIIDKMPSGSLIIINDINHYCPRNYYKKMIKEVNKRNKAMAATFSFIVNYENTSGIYKSYSYSYFNVFHKFSEIAMKTLVSFYGTKTKCSSAQLIICKS